MLSELEFATQLAMQTGNLLLEYYHSKEIDSQLKPDDSVVTEADLNSGSMRSAEYAMKMGKEIFVLPQRLDESLGTNRLLDQKHATAIHDIEAFASRFGQIADEGLAKDDFFYFCQSRPTFDESIEKFGDRVYEAELAGIITIQNGIVKLS